MKWRKGSSRKLYAQISTGRNTVSRTRRLESIMDYSLRGDRDWCKEARLTRAKSFEHAAEELSFSLRAKGSQGRLGLLS